MNENKEAVLACQGLSKIYREGAVAEVRVLTGVDLEVAAGERVSIVGASGSGKSTLLHLLGGLDSPSAGSICLMGRNLAEISDAERGEMRNRHLGFVYQFHHLLPEFSAQENVMLPQMIAGNARGAARARAAEILGRLGLGERLGHRPARLSGGEQQRVAIARALANAPKVLLADEPTGNLDGRTAEHVFALLVEVVREQGAAALIATHNPELAARMDRTVRLADGILVDGQS